MPKSKRSEVMTEFTGPWDKVQKDLNDLGKNLSNNLKLATEQNAEIVRKGLVKHIQNQDLRWKKLNKDYVKQKRKRRLSMVIWIATSQLMQSITKKMSSNRLSAFTGVLRTARRKDGENPVLIGEVHEFGSKKRGIPKRPLFVPTFKEKKPEIVKRYKKSIADVLDKVGK